MNRYFFALLLAWTMGFGVSASELEDKIRQLPNVKAVESLEVIPFFSEKFLVYVQQPIDHRDTSLGFFTQRVFLSHKGYDNPVVKITEGYNADYAKRKTHKNELCDILNANQICIEHRYFAESTPEVIDWKYLTTENAAADHHVVNQMFKTIYHGKWVSTGISKGGQTAILYKAFYPNDVDVSVPYVAPVNFGIEDGRHEPYIDDFIATKKQRKRIREFQLELLKRRASLKDDFEAFIQKKGFTFNASIDTVFDLAVLEYPFAFWQWGKDPKTIPAKDATDIELFNHFTDVSSPDYFSVEGSEKYMPFFVQAAHELGYYGYNTEPFKNYLVMKDATGYLKNYFLKGIVVPDWKPTMEWASKMVQQNGDKMLFVYGEYDPWSAPAYEKSNRKDQLILFKPKGSHKARISNLPPRLKRKAVKTLKAWVEEE